MVVKKKVRHYCAYCQYEHIRRPKECAGCGGKWKALTGTTTRKTTVVKKPKATGEEHRAHIRATKMVMNRLDMDDTICTHPDLCDEVSLGLQKAISKHDTIRAEMKDAEAIQGGIAKDTLSEKTSYKPTLADVEGVVCQIPEIQALRKSRRYWQNEVAQWEILKDTVKQRGFAVSKYAEMCTARIYTSGKTAYKPHRTQRDD